MLAASNLLDLISKEYEGKLTAVEWDEIRMEGWKAYIRHELSETF